MNPATVHPAMFQLLWLQSRGRRRRMWRRFCQPRRMLLSAIACVLAIIWLGNAALTIWLRETAQTATLHALLSMGLLLYAGWHVAKAAFFRPESPLEWSPAERELLYSLPLSPRDLVIYQLASITLTTAFKTGLFTVLLLPDLHSVTMGIVGLALAMLLLELLRLAVDVLTWGMGRGSYLAYRAVVVAALIYLGWSAVAVVLHAAPQAAAVRGENLFDPLLALLLQLNESVVGWCGIVFRPVVDLILAEQATASGMWLAAGVLLFAAALAAGVIGWFGFCSRRASKREQRQFDKTEKRDRSTIYHSPSVQRAARRAIRPPRLGGAGILAWRQMLGARRRWGSLTTAMIAPAVLACVPGFVIEDPFVALLATAGTLAFYTFLLLPTALRFDFRRDLDRLATLKAMPIAPAAAAIGQTLAPVLIATLFQAAVLAVEVFARELPLRHLLAALAVMIPLNVLVFALENVIYLLYPYRLQQEGLEIFLRTMLNFTAKGLLFALGLAALAAWGFASADVTRGISSWSGRTINAYGVFTGGLVLGATLLAATALSALAHIYRTLNPIEDLPR